MPAVEIVHGCDILDEVTDHVRDAVLLVTAAHDARDRVTWGGDRAITYWSRLPEKIRSACYGGPTLAHWWERITRILGCSQPSRLEDREAVSVLLARNDPAVLDVLRTQAEATCLLVRLAVQQHRDANTKGA